MVERPLHRTPTCLSGEWEGTLCRIAPLRAVVRSHKNCDRVCYVFGREWSFSPTPMWGEDAPPFAEGELGLANSIKAGRDSGLGESGGTGARTV